MARRTSTPVTSHLFADADLPDFDPEAASLMLARVTDFLDRVSQS